MFRRLQTAAVVTTPCCEQVRSVAGLKPKKKNKFGPKFVTDSQTWRDNWRNEHEIRLAEGYRTYLRFSSTQRKVPYDQRFAPFDRDDRDGVHVVMKYLMSDKLALSQNHGNPFKRLCCNVGIMGPQMTTQARWKPLYYANLSVKAQKKTDKFVNDEKSEGNPFYHD
jgi:hypothetical protein